MKVALTLTTVAFVFALFGCARSSLTLDKGSQKLAPVLGDESDELQFINHAVFAQVGKDAGKVDENKTGVVAVSYSELILAEGDISSFTAEEVARIPLNEIEGVAMEGPFLQVVHQDHRYMVLPYRWYTDTVDMKQLEHLSNLLESLSVPTIAASDVQWVRGIIRNAEGKGIHVVGPIRSRVSYNTENYNYDTRNNGYTNGNEVRDSQAFTPWQEWGQSDGR